MKKATLWGIMMILATITKAQTFSVSATPQAQAGSGLCQQSAAITVTIYLYTANPVYTITNSFGGNIYGSGSTVYYNPSMSSGTYTVYAKDLNTGFTGTVSFFAFFSPTTYTITSNNNFTLGCVPQNIDTVNLINVTNGGSFPTYTILPPNSSTVLSSALLSANNSFTLNMAGVYTAVVRNTNGCLTYAPFTILNNTTLPTYSLSSYQPTLTCLNPTTSISVTSSQTVNYEWKYGSVVNQNTTLTVSTNSTTVLNGLINNYSLAVINPTNSCSANSTIPVYQNIATPTVNLSSSFTLNCETGSIDLFPTVETSGWNYSWLSGIANNPTLTVQSIGIYSLSVENTINGCSSTFTTQVYQCNPVGIKEYELNNGFEKVRYFDLNGIEVSKREGEVLIEQRGTQFRKILIVN